MGYRNMLSTVGILVAGMSGLEAQTRTLSGRVFDDHTGRPVPVGVVSVKGMAISDQVRPDGVFVLHVPQRDVTLIVRSEGYLRRSTTVLATVETAFIRLIPDVFEVEAVAIRGSTADPAHRATSTTTVYAGDIDQVPSASVSQAIRGKVTGADILSNSGVPGGDLQVTLRGVTTLLGAVSPLYVLDGVVVGDAGIASGVSAVTGGQAPRPARIADLNTNDIESIEILRGAAASAMYGSKGANGVVLIRTKHGRR